VSPPAHPAGPDLDHDPVVLRDGVVYLGDIERFAVFLQVEQGECLGA
jgi:hypothetical protein